jgi:tRNA (guanine37-N1)-methyltransferase
MIIHIVTLFPEMFSALESGIPGRAQKQKLVELRFYNPRDFTHDKHKTVDDRPYGGGPGMVMKVQPLRDAIHAAKKNSNARVSYLSPQGKLFDQTAAKNLSEREEIILVSGRYEGIDERVIETEIDEEWSVGDFVLSGGELPAMCIIDAVVRLIPGALGDEQSSEQDSFSQGLLDYPHYTRPEEIDHLHVPEVLLSGDHAAIMRWRLKQSLGRTALRRSEMMKKYSLNAQEQVLLAEFLEEVKR